MTVTLQLVPRASVKLQKEAKPSLQMGAVLGVRGPQGEVGLQGMQGDQGPKGDKGEQGLKGDTGDKGDRGSVWLSGVGVPSSGSGAIGDWYINIDDGAVYEKITSTAWVFRDNLTGQQGDQGPKGDQGDKGDKGDKGDTGNTGLTGPGYDATSTTSLTIGLGSKVFSTANGKAFTVGMRVRVAYRLGSLTDWMEGYINAFTGLTMEVIVDRTSGTTATRNNWVIFIVGEKGDKGDKGDIGNQGIQGIQGPKGDKGDAGDQGIQGIQGLKGDKGDKGDTGSTGATGPAPSLAVGDTLTGPPGSSASVSMSEPVPDVYLLEFTIPRGYTGEKGDKGDPGDSVPRGFLSGLALANNSTDAVNDIDVAPGAAKDDGNTTALTTTATIVKRLDATFAEYSSPGAASGGRASADNLTGAKWFHVFIIGGSGKNTQPFFATSTSPTLPTGFTVKRRIGSIYWTGSTIRPFAQFGDEFRWLTAIDDVSTTTATGTSTPTMSVPAGVAVEWVGYAGGTNSSSALFIYLSRPGESDSSSSMVVRAPTATPTYGGVMRVRTNTSAQIQASVSVATSTLVMATRGWIDTRGKE